MLLEQEIINCMCENICLVLLVSQQQNGSNFVRSGMFSGKAVRMWNHQNDLEIISEKLFIVYKLNKQ